MKKTAFFLAILCISCFILPQLAFAGAWTLPKHNFWFEYYMKCHWSKYDFGTDRSLNRKEKGGWSYGWSMSPKAEYGLTDWITLLAGMEYKEGHYKEYNRPAAWGSYSKKSHAITSIDFGTRIRVMEDPFVLSGQIKATFYSGTGKSGTGGTGDTSSSSKSKEPGLSDGNDALEIRGLIGKKFDTAIPFYIGAETGYRFKNRNVANDIPFFVEGGFWLFNWLLIKTEIDGYWSHDGTGGIEKEYAIWRIGPVFQLFGGDSEITKAGKALDIAFQYGITFWGRNTSADQEVVMKVSAQF